LNIGHTIIALALCLACAKKPKTHDPETSSSQAEATYASLVGRLPGYSEGGFLISRGRDDRHGDSLIFTGLAVYGLSCAEGEPYAKALEAMLLSGSYYRFPGDQDAVTMDQVLGLYRGVAKRVKKCGEASRWKAAFAAAPDFDLPAGFNFVKDKLLSELGLAIAPPDAKQALLESSVALWADSVRRSRAACYRIHLGLISLQTIHLLGSRLSDLGHGSFCQATVGTSLPTSDHFCSRSHLRDFLSSFRLNEWQYRHQRCATWESPDGGGIEHPGVDYLVAYRDMQGG
jgi:hypothetical protein